MNILIYIDNESKKYFPYYFDSIYATEDTVSIKYLKPGMEAVTSFNYIKGSKLYAYCNKHALWSCEVE